MIFYLYMICPINQKKNKQIIFNIVLVLYDIHDIPDRSRPTLLPGFTACFSELPELSGENSPPDIIA